MIFLPVFIILLLGAAAVLFIMYARTKQPRYRALAIVLVKWTLIAAVLSFSVVAIDFFF
ncbi:hypothetical protein [Saezia sanguinis]|uniref:hypothetical protein n=1 Tax=Saezia sanguinis TaxID=1965230 RepID=UPI0030DDBA82